MDAGMITEWREKKRMKEEETWEKQSLNAGGIDVQLNWGGGNGREKDQKREKNGVIAINNREKIKLSASQQQI